VFNSFFGIALSQLSRTTLPAFYLGIFDAPILTIVLASGIFLGVSVFFFVQAHKHRERQEHFERLELEKELRKSQWSRTKVILEYAPDAHDEERERKDAETEHTLKVQKKLDEASSVFLDIHESLLPFNRSEVS
jgi:hypothetical protein